MEATPRPWKLIGKTIRGANGEFVGLLMDVSDESPTDADLAIRAVNSHHRLVEALEAYVSAEVPEMASEHFQERVAAAGPRGAAVVKAYHQALAALAAARGEAVHA